MIFENQCEIVSFRGLGMKIEKCDLCRMVNKIDFLKMSHQFLSIRPTLGVMGEITK